MTKNEKKETTFYRFYSETRSFLNKLLKNPISAKPNKYLEEREFGKDKLIKVLLKRGIIERKERVTDQTDSDAKKPTYTVKYKVIKTDFEKKLHDIFNDYFEKGNLNEMKSFFVDEDEMINKIKKSPDGKTYTERGGLDETDCGGVAGGDAGGYVPVINGGKPISRKTVYMTESQLRYIKECILTENLGDSLLSEDGESVGATNSSITQDSPIRGKKKQVKNIAGGLVLTTTDGRLDPAYSR